MSHLPIYVPQLPLISLQFLQRKQFLPVLLEVLVLPPQQMARPKLLHSRDHLWTFPGIVFQLLEREKKKRKIIISASTKHAKLFLPQFLESTYRIHFNLGNRPLQKDNNRNSVCSARRIFV